MLTGAAIFGWRSWFSSSGIHCPRACGCVKSQRCANGCAIVSSAKNLRRARVSLHPRRCNRPTLMPLQKQPSRQKGTSPKLKCRRNAKGTGRRRKRRKRLRPVRLNHSVRVAEPAETRAADGVAAGAGGEEVAPELGGSRRPAQCRRRPRQKAREWLRWHRRPQRRLPRRLRGFPRARLFWPSDYLDPGRVRGSSGTTSRRYPATCCAICYLTIPRSSVFRI